MSQPGALSGLSWRDRENRGQRANDPGGRRDRRRLLHGLETGEEAPQGRGHPGLAEQAIGTKHVEEAVAIRDRLSTAFDRAAMLDPGPLRRRLLTVTFVGGGFSGVKGFGELLSLPTSVVRAYPELSVAELGFHLVEARGPILAEVTDRPARWVVDSQEKHGARIHLNAELVSARDGHVVLSTGEELDSELIVCTVGNAANPLVHNHTDLAVDWNGMLTALADLRVSTDASPVPDAGGDDAAIPDRVSDVPGAATVPNAQHTVRQGKLLAKNIVATPRGRDPKPYVHHSLGTVSTLGLGRGIFQFRRLVIKGFPAWLMHPPAQAELRVPHDNARPAR
jgi:NADH dehydrogenase